MDVIRNRKNGKTKSKHKHSEKSIENNSDKEETRENGVTDMGNMKRCNNHGNETASCMKNIATSAPENKEVLGDDKSEKKKYFRVNFEVDLISVCLLLCGLATRMYRLEEPRNIV